MDENLTSEDDIASLPGCLRSRRIERGPSLDNAPARPEPATPAAAPLPEETAEEA